DFIISELKKFKLKKFSKKYIQNYKLNTNTFCGKNELAINDISLKPAVDFLISASSCSITGKYEVLEMKKEIISDSLKFYNFIKQDFSNKVILIDTLGLNDKTFSDAYNYITQRNILKAKAIIKIEDGNLTFVPSQIQKDFALIILKRKAYTQKINSVKLDIEANFLKNYKTQNIIAYIEGKSDTSIVLSAHYDHIGHMGANTFFPGANDNASGVSMLLTLAKYFSERKEKPKYNIVFMFFSGEELGLLGSKYYSENPLFPLSKIKFLMNLDMVGSGDKGIKVVNGSVFRKEFDRLSEINTKNNYLPAVKIRGAAANSDHYFFYEKGVKSFFIYTLGEYKEYHNINDKPDNLLPFKEFEGLSLLLVDFVNSF
ncbi:MAG: Zn-dependent exopeptidase M28, partial [Chlorobi bacterium]|nr:Zn-dependent exopeptidase M28 [Chlorobiota bacterium]